MRQQDGSGAWVAQPALRQVLKHPDSEFTMPFGLAQMDNGEIALVVSREKTTPAGRIFEPNITFSSDGGATWSPLKAVPGTKGRPQFLLWLGGGRLSFITETFDGGKPQRIFSSDYGRTWNESIDQPPTKDGHGFGIEGNGWVDRDASGAAKAILEIGYYLEAGKSHPTGDFTGVFRRSLDDGKTWIDEVSPPQWKFTVEHNGKKWLRGVSEGSVVRAANGDLVAALRTDMPPKYFDGPNDDSLEGTAISISKDDGKTWSELQFLFEAGRHHANLQRMPGGDLVCTLIVRDDIQAGKLADGPLTSRRRGCDAMVSKDHGRTWNLDRRYELDGFEFLRADGYWVDGVCGHVAAVVLNDGHALSVYGNYPVGAVLIKWKPDGDAGPAQKPKVALRIGTEAGELQRFAAQELSSYLKRLFDVDAAPETAGVADADVHLLVGTPRSHPAVAKALGKDGWPQVTDQGIVLKRATLDGKPALVIGGGSEAATMWAVYELVEQWGVRYLLHGDVLPKTPRAFRLPDSDVVLEPNLRVRQWRTVNDFACGPESWGLDEQRRVIDQLAKLKFNRIFVSIWPYQPLLDLEFKGTGRKSATLWYDFRYPITDDMSGRALFGNEPEFWNPDLPPRGARYEEFAAAGQRLVRGILSHAKRRGMQCAMNATITEFPPEFAPFLADCEKVHQLGSLSIVPGPRTGVDDPALAELAVAVLRATVTTYGDLDYVLLGMPEHRQWVGEYERAWQALDRKYRLSQRVQLKDVVAAAEKRTDYPGGAARAVQEVKGDIVLLYFYDRLLTDLKALETADRRSVRIIINSAAEELFPILPRILPPGSETLNFVDYTPARILKRRGVLGQIPARELPTSLIYTLHDDNVGLVPMLATGTLAEITGDIRRSGWSGFSTRYWLIGDHDPCVTYLARTAWHADATPESVGRDLVAARCGEASVNDMLELFREVETATVALEWHGLGFTFPVPGMITKHWQPEPLAEELAAVRGHYQRALAAARRAGQTSSAEGRPYVDYWTGRLEFGIGYFDAVHSFRLAAKANHDGRKADAIQHAQSALDHARSALDAYARVAQDQSDRGAIATMAEYVDRPLKAKLEELRK
ncbi:MAG: hypothetical protein HUU20_17545 [Pirellulales bacterium]|nr:hypothetical protein [Pirellulales bacterium]